MRCIDCGFFKEDEDCDLRYCRYLDEELKFDVMEEVPKDFTACPFNVDKFEEEPECVQRARKAIEDKTQKSLFSGELKLEFKGAK